MPTKQIMRRCRNCYRTTVHLKQKPNHILHLLLTVFTAGVWVIVWILVSVFQDHPICTVCGKKPKLFGWF